MVQNASGKFDVFKKDFLTTNLKFVKFTSFQDASGKFDEFKKEL